MGRESLISEMSPILSHLRREMKGRLVRKGGRVSKEKKEFAMAEERIERETNKKKRKKTRKNIWKKRRKEKKEDELWKF